MGFYEFPCVSTVLSFPLKHVNTIYITLYVLIPKVKITDLKY